VRGLARRVVRLERACEALGACSRCGGRGADDYRVEYDPDVQRMDRGAPERRPAGCPSCGKVRRTMTIHVRYADPPAAGPWPRPPGE
jgi:hypothetical protein